MTDELTSFFQQLSANPVESFADVFLAGDRDGIRPVTKDAFLQALPKRAEMFRQAGVGEVTLDRLSFDELDDRYLWARTEWNADPLRLVSSYLLERDAGKLRVVVYLNHQGL